MAERSRASGRQAAAAAAVAAVGLSAALALAALGNQPPAPGLGPRLQQALDERLRALAANLHARVSTLARAPRIAAAVSTDARTVADLTDEELGFRPISGETVLIGQLRRDKPGTALVVLRTLPPGAGAPPVDLAGPRARIAGGRLLLGDAVRVRPLERAEEIDGLIAASWVVSLDELTRDLARARATAWLQGDGGVMALMEPDTRTRRLRSEHTLQSEPGKGLRLVVDVPGRPTGSYLAASGTLAVLALLLGGLFWPRRSVSRRSAPASPPPVPTKRPPPPPPPPPLRLRVGRYEVLRLLDAGLTTEVYLARPAGDSGFDRLVVLKVLQSAFARQPEVVKMFLDEAQLASRIVHPNVVQMQDAGQAGDQYYVANEFVDGADLDRLRGISRKTGRLIPVPVALAIVRRVCDGLQAAHSATDAEDRPLGLVHGDVGGAHVLCARTGAVKIGNFGVARTSHAARAQHPGGHLAPEQRLGQPPDPRTDVFGAGAIAYELLSGAPLELDALAGGIEGWPHLRRPSALRPEVPADLDQVLLRALAFTRQARQASCDELATALAAIAARLPAITQDSLAVWVESTLSAEGTSSAG